MSTIAHCNLIGTLVRIISVPVTLRTNEEFLVGKIGTIRAFLPNGSDAWFLVELETGQLWRLFSGNVQILPEATQDDVIEEEANQFSAFFTN